MSCLGSDLVGRGPFPPRATNPIFDFFAFGGKADICTVYVKH